MEIDIGAKTNPDLFDFKIEIWMKSNNNEEVFFMMADTFTRGTSLSPVQKIIQALPF